ncbi:unnamed protein product [Kuraishia capsulata CBS 1993]|uniref:Mo25-like protein n=1 Tax=Kuraishia capsulata CBS 1993 TaxID=1382522 RepID=W6MHS3_9ASCO|nr:uncharacterized protein KUCA_T00001855001 [Kuraishia capsulata CBS 1993]CDK25884.1 unnamed protein product [Kuraishia capsulata CBS 1993]
MAFLFKRNPKTPSELVRMMNEQVTKLDTAQDKKKVQDEVSRYLLQIREILLGDDEGDIHPDQIAQLAQEVYSTDCLYLLVYHLSRLEFDSRKHVVTLFSILLRREVGNRSPTVDHLLARPRTLTCLFSGPETPETAPITGSILRECIKYDSIARFCLKDPIIWDYFGYCQTGTFENATDAFDTLRDLLTVHKKCADEFFRENLERFTQEFNSLMSSKNYVTKRQSIKLLSQLLLQKENQFFMTSYVNSPHNLKLVMILLGDKSKNIQYESFHAFKVFVANPKKTKPVSDILIKNRDKLLVFLKEFDSGKKEDRSYVNEKEFVIGKIEELPRLLSSSTDLTNYEDAEGNNASINKT